MEVTSALRDWPAIRSLPLGWTAAALVIVVLLAGPVVSVAGSAVQPAGDSWSHVTGTLLPTYLANTAFLVVVAGALAMLFGVGCAWLVSMCDFPGRRLFRTGLVLPLAVPAYMAAFTYSGMLDVTGPVQRLVRWIVPGMQDAFLYWNVMRIEVVAAIFGLVLFPYVYLPTRALFEGRLGRMTEAARMLGGGPAAVFFRVGLPLARPAVAGGMALVIMEILNDYGAVQYYGVTTLTTGIFRAWFSLGDLDTAVRLSAILMLVALVVLLLERVQRGGTRYAVEGDDEATDHDPGEAPYPLSGLGAASAVAFCTVPLLFGLVLPVGQLLLWALRTAPEVVDARFVRMSLNSFGLAAAAGGVAVAVSVVLAYAARLDRTRITRAISRVAILGYSVPGAVIAVGVLVSVLAVDRALTGGTTGALVLSGTVLALLYAYVVRFLAVGFLPVEAGFDRIGRSIAEASRTLGAAPLRTLWKVELPLLRGPLLAAVTLVVVDVLKELPLTLVLRPFNFDTLATRAFQLASDEQVAQAAPSALLVVLSAGAAVWLLHRAFGAEGAT